MKQIIGNRLQVVVRNRKPVRVLHSLIPKPYYLSSLSGGFSTIELMIAMVILILVMTAVVQVAFGNQTSLLGGQLSSEAMNKAQELLEQEQALGRKDFGLVNPVASTTDDVYEKSVYVRQLSDYLTKEVTALVTWKDTHQITRALRLTTLVSNFDTPVGANTCDSTLSGNWHSPTIENSVYNFAQLVGDLASKYTLSDVDVYEGKVYVTAITTSTATKSTLFIFNAAKLASDPLNAFLGSIDNEGVGGTTATGLSAVRIAQDPASSPVVTYAFAANGYGANYSNCNPATTRNCGQLAVFDVTTATSPVLMANLMLASSTAPFVKGTQALGTSIVYRNGYVLLGLAATGVGNGPEFHIIDMHNPTTLFGSSHIVSPVGSIAVTNGINAIAMRGTFAYFATPATQELQIVNISNPSTPTVAGSFNATSGAGHGKSMYLVGNKLYLGKTVPNTGADFHVLDISTPASTLPELGAGLDIPSSVNAVIVRDYLSFLVTNFDLRIYRTDDPLALSGATVPWGLLTLPMSGHATTEPSMDCEANRMYITANDATGFGALYVVKPL